jgi:type IX secretion system PorP/SprF family membrane protein
MKKHIIHTIFLLLSGNIAVFAQQDAMFTKYMFNTLAYNPGYAGSHEYLSLRGIYRDQWLGLDGAPVSQSVTAHTALNERVGVGMSIINDKIGAHSSTDINLSYAYRIPIRGEKMKLSVGLQGGTSNWRANWADPKLKFRDPSAQDPSFSGNDASINQWLMNFGVGVYFYAPRFYAGISSPRLIQNDLRKRSDGADWARTYRHYYLTMGSAIPVRGDDLILKSSIIVRTSGILDITPTSRPVSSPTSVDLDMSWLIYNTLWVGGAFRTAVEAFIKGANNQPKSSFDSADVWFSVNLAKGYRVGASYDFPLSKINKVSPGGYEVMVGYDFESKVNKVVTPRYF